MFHLVPLVNLYLISLHCFVELEELCDFFVDDFRLELLQLLRKVFFHVLQQFGEGLLEVHRELLDGQRVHRVQLQIGDLV